MCLFFTTQNCITDIFLAYVFVTEGMMNGGAKEEFLFSKFTQLPFVLL
jgi:hypothetical protein